jgi:hypothetical protein
VIKLENKELENIRGGGFGFLIGIGAFITFLIGVIDGYVRPLKCNK